MDCIQLSLFGKTCPEHSAPTEEKISEPCWKSLPAWDNQTLQFLDLRGGADGAKPEQSPETDGLWLGDSLTLNIGEFPNAERESLLSWILEDNVPQKYYLSARACHDTCEKYKTEKKDFEERKAFVYELNHSQSVCHRDYEDKHREKGKKRFLGSEFRGER